MIAHSPGPWRIARSNRNTLCILSENAWICGEVDNDGHPDRKDNARLIAAAPELLAALRCLLEVPADPDIMPIYQARARALIARLDGAA